MSAAFKVDERLVERARLRATASEFEQSGDPLLIHVAASITKVLDLLSQPGDEVGELVESAFDVSEAGSGTSGGTAPDLHLDGGVRVDGVVDSAHDAPSVSAGSGVPASDSTVGGAAGAAPSSAASTSEGDAA